MLRYLQSWIDQLRWQRLVPFQKNPLTRMTVSPAATGKLAGKEKRLPRRRLAVQSMPEFWLKGTSSESASHFRGYSVGSVGNVTRGGRLRIRCGRAEFPGCSDFFGTCARILPRDKSRDVFPSAIARRTTLPPAGVSVQLEAPRYTMEAGWSAGTCNFVRRDYVQIPLPSELYPV